SMPYVRRQYGNLSRWRNLTETNHSRNGVVVNAGVNRVRRVSFDLTRADSGLSEDSSRSSEVDSEDDSDSSIDSSRSNDSESNPRRRTVRSESSHDSEEDSEDGESEDSNDSSERSESRSEATSNEEDNSHLVSTGHLVRGDEQTSSEEERNGFRHVIREPASRRVVLRVSYDLTRADCGSTEDESESSIDSSRSSDSEDDSVSAMVLPNPRRSRRARSSEDGSSESNEEESESDEESSEEERERERSFAVCSDDTTAPSLRTESEDSNDERFMGMLAPMHGRSYSTSSDETESTTDASEDEISEDEEDDEKGYTSEEEEEEDYTSEEEEDEEGDDVSDEESDEESCLEDEEMLSEDDDEEASSPPCCPSHATRPRLPMSATAPAPVQHSNDPNTGRRIGTAIRIHRDEEEQNEGGRRGNERESAMVRHARRDGRRVIRVSISESDDDDSGDLSSDSDVSIPESSEEDEISEDEREQREAEDKQRVTSASTALLGACTICHEDDVVEPAMCKNCKNIVGCYTCVSRWMRAANQPQCPLCREKWTESADSAIAVRLLY
ncbi:hypothetical protein PMAYCL1PPCAC_03025, partial [Pristionchus mayeri]